MSATFGRRLSRLEDGMNILHLSLELGESILGGTRTGQTTARGWPTLQKLVESKSYLAYTLQLHGSHATVMLEDRPRA